MRLQRAIARLIAFLPCAMALAEDAPQARRAPFKIEVVDQETGRGIPLVELRTVNQIRYITDSAGIAAFDEPGLLGKKVYFSITSHGYEFEKDGFGYHGKAVETTPGGSVKLVMRRMNLARRLYRVTGAGIYRDTILTGGKPPIREPLLNGLVLGQDSVLTAIYQGKIHWFWGDTNRPDYPLGNFHTPGATSLLPGQGGLDPEVGVDLSYFVDERGFARPTAPMPGDGPTWLSGLVVLTDQADGRERMFASYAKVRNMLEVYERGLVEWDPKQNRFEKRMTFPDESQYVGELPDGHPLLVQEADGEYVYFASPYPLTRVRATPEHLMRLGDYQAYTCLLPGVKRHDPPRFDRDEAGRVRYTWKTHARVMREDEQRRAIAAGRIRKGEVYLNLRDVETGRAVRVHGASVYWNPYRRQYLMIAVESPGETSQLGEIWCAFANAPVGPWRLARKIVTHTRYSFYNPKQHPMLAKEGGKVVFFEGTYTTTFSGNPDPTPRYDYNQVMYSLDLSDPRLSLPGPGDKAPAGG